MTDLPDSMSPGAEARAGLPAHHHSGIGFTEWMALGLVAFTILLVLVAVLVDLFQGSPGGLAALHSAAPL